MTTKKKTQPDNNKKPKKFGELKKQMEFPAMWFQNAIDTTPRIEREVVKTELVTSFSGVFKLQHNPTDKIVEMWTGGSGCPDTVILSEEEFVSFLTAANQLKKEMK